MSDLNLQINGSNLILLPQENTTQNFLHGFWQWVEILALDDYVKALEALYWERRRCWKPEELKDRITTFLAKRSHLFLLFPTKD